MDDLGAHCGPARGEPHGGRGLGQTTLVRCYLSWAKVDGADNRDAYVTRILVNAFRHSRRRRWWGERPSGDLPETAGPEPTSQVHLADAVTRALHRLGPEQQEVVVLRFFLQFTEAEAADALNIPVGTAKSRLSRALKKLAADEDLTAISDGTS